jgi:hypothetical protein
VSGGVERIDCFIMAGIKKTDYDQIKRQVLYKIADADPDVKRAINDRAIKFFSDDRKQDVANVHKPAAVPESALPKHTSSADKD